MFEKLRILTVPCIQNFLLVDIEKKKFAKGGVSKKFSFFFLTSENSAKLILNKNQPDEH
jgi:hypothetical protein